MDVRHENIIVTELPGGAGAPAAGDSVFGRVLGVYEQHGYEAGQRRALRDVLLSLLSVTEDLIRRRNLDDDVAENLRRAAWAVGEQLHRDSPAPCESGFVEGGLGI